MRDLANPCVRFAFVLCAWLAAALAAPVPAASAAGDDRGHDHPSHHDAHDEHDHHGDEHGRDDHDDGHDRDAHDDDHHDDHDRDAHGDARDDHHDENLVAMTAEAATRAGIRVVAAAGADLERTLELGGRVSAPRDAVANLGARYAGLVVRVDARAGDFVEAGATVAVVESNASLSKVPIVAPRSGVVIDVVAGAGEVVAEGQTVAIVADLTKVWIDFDVYAIDASSVHAGDEIVIAGDGEREAATTTIAYVSPIGDPHTQTTMARAVVDNASGRWKPGLFVSAVVRRDEALAAVAVPVSSLQRWQDGEAVFVQSERGFVATPVRVGRRGPALAEILDGVAEGDRVAAGQTFVLKASLLADESDGHHDH